MTYQARTVLVIEDDPGNRLFLLDLLLSYGYNAEVASTGEEGLKLALQTRPQLILLDLGLPDLNGRTIARRLRDSAAYCGAPIVAISAWTGVLDAEQALRSGCNEYLEKPLEVSALLDVLARHVDKRPSTP